MIHLIVSDVMMPDMDGIKMLHELKKINPSIPVVLSSGYAESLAITKVRQEIEFGFIQKPYKAQDMVDLILMQIEKYRASA